MGGGWSAFQQDFRDKRVLVFGLGLQGGGAGVVKTFVLAGAQVRVTDAKTEEELASSLRDVGSFVYEKSFNGHKQEDVEWADVIVKNPSVPFEQEQMKWARAHGKKITNDSALFMQYTRTKTIGITGTRGKTTTTMMIYEGLKIAFGKEKVRLGGNIPGEAALPLLQHESEDMWTVLELSSFQLEGCHDVKVSPHIAVVTNIYEDHLNRHGTIEAYAEAKAAIVAYQSADDMAVLPKLSPYFSFFSQKTKAKVLPVDVSELPSDLTLSVPGEHNRENAAAARVTLQAVGLDQHTIRTALEHFSGVPSRLEKVADVNGITFMNDTTSTTPIALAKALEAIHGSIILITGGTTKKLNLDVAVEALKNNTFKKVLALEGTGTEELQALLPSGFFGTPFHTLEEAFHEAIKIARSGDIVLLSPGFTSFGMFTNEFHRGDVFNKLVHAYEEQVKPATHTADAQ